MNMTLDYLAGLLDGEGHLKMSRGSDRFHESWRKTEMRVTMTTVEPVKSAYETFGGNFYGPYEKRTQTGKPFYIWSVIKRNDLLPLLKQVAPHLILKRHEAEAMIEYIESEPPNKKRGKSVQKQAEVV